MAIAFLEPVVPPKSLARGESPLLLGPFHNPVAVDLSQATVAGYCACSIMWAKPTGQAACGEGRYTSRLSKKSLSGDGAGET